LTALSRLPARFAQTHDVYDDFALEVFCLIEVHEEKRLKARIGSVYFSGSRR